MRKILRYVKDAYYFLRRKAFQVRHGFDYTDTWSLDYSLSKWILPRLKYFKDNHTSHPGCFTPEEWDAVLGKMIAAFELISEDDYLGDNSKQKIVDDGLDLFREFFQHLWD